MSLGPGWVAQRTQGFTHATNRASRYISNRITDKSCNVGRRGFRASSAVSSSTAVSAVSQCLCQSSPHHTATQQCISIVRWPGEPNVSGCQPLHLGQPYQPFQPWHSHVVLSGQWCWPCVVARVVFCLQEGRFVTFDMVYV